MNLEEQRGVRVVELSSKEIWTYERQIDLLTNRIKELEEAGIYCVSGYNKIQPEHKTEYRQLKDAVSIFQQKAAGIVNPKPQVTTRRPRREQRKKPRTDAEWEALATAFAKARAEAGL
jgi:hypothetical protein